MQPITYPATLNPASSPLPVIESNHHAALTWQRCRNQSVTVRVLLQ